MSRRVELGVMAAIRGPGSLDLVRQAELRGFDSLWTADANPSDAFASAGAVAAITTRPTIGTAVALRVRTPLQTVFACATLADLSGGRFVFGIGAGPRERLEDWHGIYHSPAIGRMREYITLMRRLWESSPSAPVSFEGRFYRVAGYGRPTPASSALPIYLGCSGPIMTRLAGELTDGLVVHVLHSRSMIRERTLPALEIGAKRAGRSLDGFRLGVGLFTAVDGDRNVAINRIRHQIVWALRLPYNQPLLGQAGFPGVTEAVLDRCSRGDLKGAVAAIPEELVLQVALCGTPSEVRDQLEEWGELVEFVTLNGVGAYMNVVPPEWRLPIEELDRNRAAIYDLMPLPNSA